MKFIKIPNQNYEMMNAPITQKDWIKFMDNNPSYFKDQFNNPVESVSWDDVQEFIKVLNSKGSGKYIYRLPTEEEWEFCCRAGSTTDYYFGDGVNELGKYAWYNENSENKTQPVKQKIPNNFALYDMLGNVWEWTDNRDESYRVGRGGDWDSYADYLRSSSRYGWWPEFRSSNVGFRLVRVLCSPVPFYPNTVDKNAILLALEKAQSAIDELKELIK